MSSKTVARASVLVLLLIIVSAFLVCAEAKDVNIQEFGLLTFLQCRVFAGGRELANEKVHKVGGYSKEHPATASEKGTTASGDMVKTNDYGRYDPTPAFSKPRFKLIPN
nr:unnamed protein product [Digitaria exilis]